MLVVVAGPTGVGKSDFAIRLAKEINGEIVSADSMQIYKAFDIGTAKVTKDEMCGVVHHMIDCVDASTKFSVYDFKLSASKIIEDIFSRGKVPILVGGTGLYIDAVLYPFQFGAHSPEIKQKYIDISKEKDGARRLYEMLMEKAPDIAKDIHENNVKRVIRNLELIEMGAHFTEDMHTCLYDHIYIVLNRPRQVLYENAEKRVDKMISLGLMEEVKFLSQKYGWECQAMQAIGYKEWRQYLEENVDLEDVISQIKINTRHYVKRQLTWFRRTKNAVWLEADKIEENILLVKGMINNQK